MAGRTASEDVFINSEIEAAFHRHGVVPGSPLKPLLAKAAEVETGGRIAAVRIRDEHGRVLTLDDKLDEMKQEYMFKHHFPVGPPIVPATDLQATRANFDEIRTGRVRVE